MSDDVKGTCAGTEVTPETPCTREKGDVSYIAAFPGTFVTHTEEDARKNAETFCAMADIAVYRIEVIDIVRKLPETPEAPEPGRTA